MQGYQYVPRCNVGIIFLLLAAYSLFGCWDVDIEQTDVNQDQSDCDCTGNYSIIYYSAPSTYNCEAGGYFEITMEPSIDTCYKGISIMWFELVGPYGYIYCSNTESFSSDQARRTDIPFGGSIPSGTYEITGHLIDMQAACADSICEDIEKDMGQIEITGCLPPQKTMQIELAYQYDTIANISYNVFQSPTLSIQMSHAFNAANTKYELFEGNSILDDGQLIDFHTSSVEVYIEAHKISLEMFLCGVKGFCDAIGNYDPLVLGLTIMDSVTFLPYEKSGNLVGIQACSDVSDSLFGFDMDDLINSVTIHELGHQRAIKSHFGHWSVYCVMNSGPVGFTGYSSVTRIWNPYFCGNCISLLNSIEWKGGH